MSDFCIIISEKPVVIGDHTNLGSRHSNHTLSRVVSTLVNVLRVRLTHGCSVVEIKVLVMHHPSVPGTTGLRE
jgi:hypothetical protein